MAEQQQNDANASDDVSMDEILTSLRNILEDEPEQSSGQSEVPATDNRPAEEGPSGEDNSEEELVLTDVVTGSPESVGTAGPDPDSEPSPVKGIETAEAQSDSAESGELGDLAGDGWGQAGRSDSELELDSGSVPDAGTDLDFGSELNSASGLDLNSEPSLDWDPDQEAAEIPDQEAGDESSDFPDSGGATLKAFDPEGTRLGRAEEPAPEQEPGFEATAPATAPAEPAPEAASTTAEPPAPALDTEAVRETVETTVREQVEQATADLDSRLAEALEPKIREALQSYLSERLPGLLRELAEAEIERIKQGE